MIYFLVNNDYQYLEAERLAAELRAAGQETALIAIPHTLTRPLDAALFSPIITLATPAGQPWRRAWLRYLGARKRLREALPVTSKDTLAFFTEYELLNQLAAMIFKERGGRAYLVEDGGVGTYIPLTLKRREPYSVKDWLLLVSMLAIPGLLRTRFTKFDGILFPMLEDRRLDGICLYRCMSISRRVPVHVITRPRLPSIPTQAGRVVFLNQPLYSEHIQTEQVYAEGLRTILAALQSGYSEVLFKFHPRESAQARARITEQILGDFPSVQVLQGSQPIEVLLSELRPEAVASYNSTPLLNLAGTGVQPLFVYHLLPDLRNAPSFDAMHDLLQAWGYRFAASWNEVISGYHAGEDFDNIGTALPLARVLAQCKAPASSDSESPASAGPAAANPADSATTP